MFSSTRVSGLLLITVLLCGGVVLASIFRSENRSFSRAATGSVEQHEYDCGTVLVPVQGSADFQIEHSFPLKNASTKQPLQLAVQETTCGCITAEAPAQIPPAGQAEIRMAFSPALAIEERNEFVLVKTSQPERKEIGLTLKAKTVPVIGFDIPPSIDVQRRDEKASATIKILLHRSQSAVKPDAATVTADYLELQRQEVETRAMGNQIHQTALTYRATLTESGYESLRRTGAYKAFLIAEFDDQRRTTHVKFSMPRAVKPSPAALFLRDNQPHQPPVIALSCEVPFQLGPLTDSQHLLSLKQLTEGAVKTHQIAVSLQENPKQELVKTQITAPIETFDHESVVVPVFVLGDDE